MCENLHVLIASDSFKGSLSSPEVADYIESGLRELNENIRISKLPVADGGEGTVEALVESLDGEIKYFEVFDVFFNKTKAKMGLIDKDSVILEAASPGGLHLLEEDELDPYKASSYGLGQMIRHALDLNKKKIFIGIGGSSTNDGGVGMARALGVKFLDSEGKDIPDGAKGLEHLEKIDIEDIDDRIKDVEVFVISDVSNVLTGKDGATYVYGPQKGIKSCDLEEIDEWMKKYGLLLENTFNLNISKKNSSGAAGGIGAALMVFADAKIYTGIEKVLEMINLDSKLKGVDLVITGEGRMDYQSKFGKAPVGVAKHAKKYNLPVIALVGAYDNSVIHLYDEGIDMIMNISNEPMSLSESKERAPELLKNVSKIAFNNFVNICNQ